MSSLSVISQQSLSTDPRRVALAQDPFEPQSMPDLMEFARCVAGTDFAPKGFQGKPEACFIAMIYGRGLGLGALQALQGIAVINGKPSVYGDTFWAVICSHPEFVDCEEDVTDDRAEIVLTRRNRKPWTGGFSMAEAKLAKLTDKDGPWKQYPKGQLLWRARHRGAVALFSDALKGILPREVALDYVDGEIVAPKTEAPAISAQAATSAPAPAEKGEQAKPVEDADPKITPDQAKQWNDGWAFALQEAGVTDQKERNRLKRADMALMKIERSGEIRLSQFEASLQRARAYKLPEVAKPEPATQDEDPADEESARDAIKKALTELNFGLFEVDAFFAKHTRDGIPNWDAMAREIGQTARDRGIEL